MLETRRNMTTIHNPILPGFHPDPSILRVGDDYYIATSTFEWLPGIRIHHSRDLVHWHPAAYALTRPSQINMRGYAPSCGVWAPCLTRDPEAGTFYLLYSEVKSNAGFFDVDNLLVTAESIEGPWSDPVYLNSNGFDPSLFHDTDGRKWVVNLELDLRKDAPQIGWIVLQEYSPHEQCLIGEARRIYSGGTALGCLEGPHIYRHGKYYYLLAAEGGTDYGHVVTMARSQLIGGPYEPDPENPIITAVADLKQAASVSGWQRPELYNPAAPLQKTGHASLVRAGDDRWYMPFLCGRPLMPQQCCVLGRETAIARVEWTEDHWLRLAGDGRVPPLDVEAPDVPSCMWEAEPERDDFDSPQLGPQWNVLRRFAEESWLSLSQRPGHLRLRGRDSLRSRFDQSLVARRVTSFDWRARTSIEFTPRRQQHSTGLVCYYDETKHFYLRVYWDEAISQPCVGIQVANIGHHDEIPGIQLPGGVGQLWHLQAECHGAELQFSMSFDGNRWQLVGPALDMTLLSDESGGAGHFTGTFVGLCCQDLWNHSIHADFDYFDYRDL